MTKSQVIPSLYNACCTCHHLNGVDNKLIYRWGTKLPLKIFNICTDVEGMYLSQTALAKLQISEHDFPKQLTSTPTMDKTNVIADSTPTASHTTAPCGCLPHIPCHPLPSNLPLPATPENTIPLENWIKEYFASSTFNTCPNQKLHTMSGDPLDISFIDGHTPAATQNPIPVPHHWKELVKAQLDSDVALRIIEPVPTGTPTQIFTIPKKDGFPPGYSICNV